MESRGIFSNISPLDHRYSVSDPALFSALSSVLSEDASIAYCVRVECALVRALAAHGVGPGLGPADEAALTALETGIAPEEVYAEEQKTQHNVRALVNVMARRLPASLAPLVHLGATSVDILDTANALRCRDAARAVVLPLLLDLEQELARLARGEAGTPQVGRTHGQHAVPITFGFAMAGYVSRLGKSVLRIRSAADDLRGKLAGAVGSYNATSLLVTDPVGLERDFLAAAGAYPVGLLHPARRAGAPAGPAARAEHGFRDHREPGRRPAPPAALRDRRGAGGVPRHAGRLLHDAPEEKPLELRAREEPLEGLCPARGHASSWTRSPSTRET